MCAVPARTARGWRGMRIGSREGGVVGHDSTGVTERAEVLAGIEAEACRARPKEPGPAAPATSPRGPARRPRSERDARAGPRRPPSSSISGMLPVEVDDDDGRGRARRSPPSTSSGVIRSVSGVTSAKRGTAPAQTTASAVAMNVLAGTITSSPGRSRAPAASSSIASVPFATPTAWRGAAVRRPRRPRSFSTAAPPMNARAVDGVLAHARVELDPRSPPCIAGEVEAAGRAPRDAGRALHGVSLPGAGRARDRLLRPRRCRPDVPRAASVRGRSSTLDDRQARSPAVSAAARRGRN